MERQWDGNAEKSLPLLQKYSIDQLSRIFESIKFVSSLPSIWSALWYPPEPGIIKVIVVGAARGCARIRGIGGILRNCRNEVLGFFSKNIGAGFAIEAVVFFFEGLQRILFFSMIQ